MASGNEERRHGNASVDERFTLTAMFQQFERVLTTLQDMRGEMTEHGAAIRELQGRHERADGSENEGGNENEYENEREDRRR